MKFRCLHCNRETVADKTPQCPYCKLDMHEINDAPGMSSFPGSYNSTR